MDKLKEALALLLGHSNQDEVVSLVETQGSGLFQKIFQKGHDVGYGKKHAALDRATEELTGIKAKLATAEEQITTLKANPETKAIHEQYAGQIKSLTDAAKARETELLTGIRKERHSSHLSTLRTALKAKLQPDYADVLLEKGENSDRIKVNDDGTWTVLQKGKDIPLAAQTPEAALSILADELVAGAPAGFVLAATDAGGGMGQNGQGKSQTPTGAAATAASIREGVKKSVTPNAPAPRGPFAVLTKQQ